MTSVTTRATSSKQLMKILATPSRVASILDWKKSVGDATIATLDVHADRIGVRISSHPQQSTHPQPRSLLSQPPSSEARTPPPPSSSSYHSFPVSSKGRSKIPAATRKGLSDLIHRYGVCGFVVSWPVQEDTGRMGAACGRTLFAIEELLRETHSSGDGDGDESVSPVFVPGRPLCLWDRNHRAPATADAFGRSPSYARIRRRSTTTTTTTPGSRTGDAVASSGGESPRATIQPDDSTASARVWDDFVRVHWPGLDRGRPRLRL